MNNFLTTTESIVKDICVYNKEPGDKIFSGSMLGNELLQNYLRIIDRRSDEDKVFSVGQNSIGSVFHLGMETLTKEKYSDNCKAELKVKRELSNGWTITGTIDRYDINENSIHDYKTTKSYKLKMLKSDIESNRLTDGYILQMNVYRWAMNNNCDMYLDLFIKDNKEIDGEPAYVQLKVPEIPNIEEILLNATNEINDVLESGLTPAQCEDLWWRKNKNKDNVASRCELYCDVKGICPHYHTSISKSLVSNW